MKMGHSYNICDTSLPVVAVYVKELQDLPADEKCPPHCLRKCFQGDLLIGALLWVVGIITITFWQSRSSGDSKQVSRPYIPLMKAWSSQLSSLGLIAGGSGAGSPRAGHWFFGILTPGPRHADRRLQERKRRPRQGCLPLSSLCR